MTRSSTWREQLLAMLTGCKGHWEDVEGKLGYKGQARTDCFLAARQLIEEFDIEAERRAVLDKMPEDDMGVLVLSAENVVSAARSEQILKWVKDGDHLIYPMAGCGAYNDWGMFSAMSGYAYFGNDTRPDNILRELGVTAHDRRADEMKKLMKKSGLKKAEKTDEANKTDEATEEPKKKESKKKKQGIKDPDDVPTGLFEMSWDGEIYKIEVPDFVTFKYDHELRAGDYAYFKNFDVSNEGREAGWQGENVIALGGGKFYGHPFGISTEEHIVTYLNQNRNAGSTRSAAMIDMQASLSSTLLGLDKTPGE